MIYLLITLGLLSLYGLHRFIYEARCSRATRQALERYNRAELPLPEGFDDCTPAMLAALRDGNRLTALKLYKERNGTDLKTAIDRISALSVATGEGNDWDGVYS